MAILTTYNDINKTQWRRLVETSAVATWFQTPESYDFYASLPDVMTPFVFAVSRGEVVKGVVLGYITKENNHLRQHFTRRAIIVGGPLLAEDIFDDELTELLRTLGSGLQALSIYIETRNFGDYSRWREVFEKCGFAYRPHYDMHIDCADREQMERSISESKMRQVRHALENGTEIIKAEKEEDVVAFYTLLSALYKEKVHKPLFPLQFFTTFVRNNVGVLLLAKQHGKVVGGMLCPMLKDKVLYEWYVVGPSVITWAALDFANTEHLPLFDLMGAGEPGVPYGVRDFKMQFGGKLKEYGRFLHVNNRLLYNIGCLGLKYI